MQSLAVLLLDMAYRGKKSQSTEHDPHIGCIKKLNRWLRAMESQDAVAKRAYHVIWKILKTCAPVLQNQANELLTEDGDSHDQPQPRMYSPEDKPDAHHDYGLWQMEGLANNPPPPHTYDNANFTNQSTTGPVQDPGYVPPYPLFMGGQTPAPMTFGNPFITSFDQGAPVVSMQDLWMNPTPVYYGGDGGGLDDTAMGYQQQTFMPNPGMQGYWPPESWPPEQQQQQQYQQDQ